MFVGTPSFCMYRFGSGILSFDRKHMSENDETYLYVPSAGTEVLKGLSDFIITTL